MATTKRKIHTQLQWKRIFLKISLLLIKARTFTTLALFVRRMYLLIRLSRFSDVSECVLWIHIVIFSFDRGPFFPFFNAYRFIVCYLSVSFVVTRKTYKFLLFALKFAIHYSWHLGIWQKILQQSRRLPNKMSYKYGLDEFLSIRVTVW